MSRGRACVTNDTPVFSFAHIIRPSYTVLSFRADDVVLHTLVPELARADATVVSS